MGASGMHEARCRHCFDPTLVFRKGVTPESDRKIGPWTLVTGTLALLGAGFLVANLRLVSNCSASGSAAVVRCSRGRGRLRHTTT